MSDQDTIPLREEQLPRIDVILLRESAYPLLRAYQITKDPISRWMMLSWIN